LEPARDMFVRNAFMLSFSHKVI